MPITDPNQAERAAQWARDNPEDPRRADVIDQLREYRTSQESAQAATAAASDESPDVTVRLGPQLTPEEEARVANLRQLAEEHPTMRQAIEAEITAIENPGRGFTLTEQGVAVADIGFTMAKAVIAEPLAGIAGLLSMAAGFDNEFANEVINRVRDPIQGFGGTGPQSRGGKEFFNILAKPFAKYDDFATWTATTLSDGNPLAATAIYTTMIGGLDAVPILKGLKTNRTAARQASKEAAAALEAQAERMGIGLEGAGWKEQVVDVAQAIANDQPLPGQAAAQVSSRVVPGADLLDQLPIEGGVRVRSGIRPIAERASDFEQVASGMRRARQASNDALDVAFQRARRTPAYIQTRATTDLASHMDDLLRERGFDLRRMGDVPDLLDDLRSLPDRTPTGATVQNPQFANLNELEIIRRRIGEASGVTPSEGRALGLLREEMDAFLDNEFNSRAVLGDQRALTNWRDARELAAAHRNNFSENRAITQLINKEVSPEQMRNWLIGASDSLPLADVTSTVRRMRDVLGPDSPEMLSLRMEFTRGLMQPLLKADPSYTQFVNNVDTFLSKRGSLAKELGFDMGQVRQLRDMTDAFRRHGPNGFLGNLSPHVLLARFTVGHSIARKGAMVALAASGLKAITGTLFGQGQRNIMNHIVGKDLFEPFIPKSSVAAASFISAAATEKLGLGTPTEDEEQENLSRGNLAILQQGTQQ